VWFYLVFGMIMKWLCGKRTTPAAGSESKRRELMAMPLFQMALLAPCHGVTKILLGTPVEGPRIPGGPAPCKLSGTDAAVQALRAEAEAYATAWGMKTEFPEKDRQHEPRYLSCRTEACLTMTEQGQYCVMLDKSNNGMQAEPHASGRRAQRSAQ